ncbi:MAG: hypothetical protein QOG49_538 [Frankiaceae bacterium]|jgi:aminoglycoside phosphotransferase (APT) family kinase protein|nr:hypothetical protein [Frankiaceae bacterium]
MHAHEFDIDDALVRRLLAQQFPQWAALPLERVASAGTDNALFRLADDKVVRLPRVRWAVGQVEKERRWLPELAPQLPLPIPVPLAMGVPSAAYPWHWSVYRWLDGVDATAYPIGDLGRAATEVAALTDIDPRPIRAAWAAALAAPPFTGRPRWIHGDLLIAWTLLDAQTRGTFRDALRVDDATWAARGRGWALTVGLVALPYYLNSNPTLVTIARRAIEEVLADDGTDAGTISLPPGNLSL